MKKLLIIILLVTLIGCTCLKKKETVSKVITEEGKILGKMEAGTVQTFDDIEFVYIPAGSFMMGLPEGRDCENKIHKVTITKGFWFSKYEINQTQWENVMGKNPYKIARANFPIEGVSWSECSLFINRLNNKKYRLPTEAEWEYACRAGTSTTYFFGESGSKLDKYCWFYGQNGGSLSIHEVGLKNPNPWGLYDMYGNVYEWCQDLYDTSYYSISPENDPKGSDDGIVRIIRGGYYRSNAEFCNSGVRYFAETSQPGPGNGFRLLREE